MTLEAPSILSLSAAYRIKVTLRHHHNAAGNPNDRPATFSLKDTVLTTIDDTDIFPWLVLRHVKDKMIEVDDGNHGPERPSDVDTSEGNGGPTAVSAESGFVSLAVGESISLNTDLHVTGEGIQFEIGEKYSLGFRGCHLYWWKWGTLEASISAR